MIRLLILVLSLSSKAFSFQTTTYVRNHLVFSGKAACNDSFHRTPLYAAGPGDKVRESNGKRPSLNPTIINAISEALLIRSMSDTKNPMEITENVQPLEVAMAAGKLATQCIEKRSKSSTAVKGDESSAFTHDEAQLICGRVVGVVMRWDELERILIERVKAQTWITKYGEENSFGVIKEELSEGDVKVLVKKKMKDDPLCRMCRAECLYALFLKTVEQPTMEKLGQIPVDGHSGVDFIDSERLEVLFPKGFD